MGPKAKLAAGSGLSGDDFVHCFLKALGTESVREELARSMGEMLELVVEEKVNAVKTQLNEKMAEMKRRHEGDVKQLKDEIKELRKKQGDIEQYSRREDLIIKGLEVPQTLAERVRNSRPEGQQADTPSAASPRTVEIVTNFLQDTLGVSTPNGSISTAHPLPSRNGQATVIVRFSSRDVRNAVYANRFRLKGKRIYIEEHLTAENAKAMYEARQLKRQGKLRDCFTKHCTPFVRLVDNRVVPLTDELLHNMQSN